MNSDDTRPRAVETAATNTPRPKKTQERGPHGVLVVNKPRGPTSFGIVAQAKRVYQTRHVGHAGTLDPMASGVLLLLLGEATKLSAYLTDDDKTYLATIRLGTSTDTLDAEGAVTASAELPPLLSLSAVLEGVLPSDPEAEHSQGGEPYRAPELNPEARELHALFGDALAIELARREQVPPSYSAIQVDGRRAYDLARRGQALALPARHVEVKRLQLVAWRSPELQLRMTVSKGYYVRSLARDLAATLGVPGHLCALVREQSGVFAIEQAVPWPPDPEGPSPPPLGSVSAAVKRSMDYTVLTEDGVTLARQGKPLGTADFVRAPKTNGLTAWLDAKGYLVALGELREDGFRVRRGFNPV
ncbi:MAG: hypothetical protein RJA70_2581 [Pseudomonadota bacterium]